MDINKKRQSEYALRLLRAHHGLFRAGYADRITYFDIFFRSVPDNGGFAIAAGLEQAIEYVQ